MLAPSLHWVSFEWVIVFLESSQWSLSASQTTRRNLRMYRCGPGQISDRQWYHESMCLWELILLIFVIGLKFVCMYHKISYILSVYKYYACMNISIVKKVMHFDYVFTEIHSCFFKVSKHSENPEMSMKCTNDQKIGTNWVHNDQDR